MKKNYIVPETKTFRLQIGHLMSVSSISGDSVGEGSASSTVNLGRRGHSDWDDED